MANLPPIDIQVPNFIGILQAAQQYKQNQFAQQQAAQEAQRLGKIREYAGIFLGAPAGSPEKLAAEQAFAAVAPAEYLGLKNQLLQQDVLRKQALPAMAKPPAPSRPGDVERLLAVQFGLNPDDPETRNNPQFQAAVAQEIENRRKSAAASRAAQVNITNQVPLATPVATELQRGVIESQPQIQSLTEILKRPGFEGQFTIPSAAKEKFLSTKARLAPSTLSEGDRAFLEERAAIFGPLAQAVSEFQRQEIGSGRTATEVKSLEDVIAGKESNPIRVRATIAKFIDRAEKVNQLRAYALANGAPVEGKGFAEFVKRSQDIFNQPPSPTLVNSVGESLANAGLNDSQVRNQLRSIFPSLAKITRGQAANQDSITRSLGSLPPIGIP